MYNYNDIKGCIRFKLGINVANNVKKNSTVAHSISKILSQSGFLLIGLSMVSILSVAVRICVNYEYINFLNTITQL